MRSIARLEKDIKGPMEKLDGKDHEDCEKRRIASIKLAHQVLYKLLLEEDKPGTRGRNGKAAKSISPFRREQIETAKYFLNKYYYASGEARGYPGDPKNDALSLIEVFRQFYKEQKATLPEHAIDVEAIASEPIEEG